MTINAAWEEQNGKFKETGVELSTYVMDNEAAKDLKDVLKNMEIIYQLVPPHNHKTNISEQAM